LSIGSRIRIFQCRHGDRGIVGEREFLYELNPPPTPAGFREPVGGRGLSELLALSDTELLTLERSFVRETVVDSKIRSDQRIELYHIDLHSGTDVGKLASLRGDQAVTPLSKTLVLDLRTIIPELDPRYPSLDNFEGMCFGPTLEDGSRTLLLISDNNFNPMQRTALLAFRILPES
jgi:hypothetical protein